MPPEPFGIQLAGFNFPSHYNLECSLTEINVRHIQFRHSKIATEIIQRIDVPI